MIVDTGVTTQFRAALLAATRKVGEWSRALVLTTHGHTDHVGNNDIADELGVPAEHYVPAGDLGQMLDPGSYWVRAFTPIAGVVPLPAPPALAGHKVVSLFQPLHPFASVTRTYEERPLERIRIGSTRFTGWTFVDGAVRVLRSQGHCAGHVIVHLRDSGILHLSDEANGPCGAMADADQLKIQTTIGAAATMFEEGEAAVLTDGHTFTVRRGDEPLSYLDGLLDQATALQEAALGIAKADAVDPAERLHRALLRRPHRHRRRGRQPQPLLHRDGGEEPAPRDRAAAGVRGRGRALVPARARESGAGAGDAPWPRHDPGRGGDDALEAAGPRQARRPSCAEPAAVARPGRHDRVAVDDHARSDRRLGGVAVDGA